MKKKNKPLRVSPAVGDNWTKKCPRFISCNAPLCPLDPELHKRIWIADEPVCTRKDISLPWLEQQRRYKKLGVRGYFKVGRRGLKRIR